MATGETVAFQDSGESGPEIALGPETWKTEKLAGGLGRTVLWAIEQAVLHPAPFEPFERPTVKLGIVACVVLKDR